MDKLNIEIDEMYDELVDDDGDGEWWNKAGINEEFWIFERFKLELFNFREL